MPHLIAILSASLRLHFLTYQKPSDNLSTIPKPSGDLSLPKGFRPISLLSCVSKAFERL